MQTGSPYITPAKSPSPSLAGQTVIVNRAVLLAPGHHFLAPSQKDFALSSDINAMKLAVTVAGPLRLLPASLLSHRNYAIPFDTQSNLNIELFSMKIATGKILPLPTPACQGSQAGWGRPCHRRHSRKEAQAALMDWSMARASQAPGRPISSTCRKKAVIRGRRKAMLTKE